jgi:hypothetical protein
MKALKTRIVNGGDWIGRFLPSGTLMASMTPWVGVVRLPGAGRQSRRAAGTAACLAPHQSAC